MGCASAAGPVLVPYVRRRGLRVEQGIESYRPISHSLKKELLAPFLMNGGEGGIRTLDRGYLYTLSRRAPSTTRTPLLEVTHPATPKRPSPLLPLLPSGPGGVHSISPQGDQVGHHRAAYPSGIEVRMKLKGASFERTDNGPIDDR